MNSAMEWVETVGASVEEATEKALDHLGVPVEEAEVTVVAEPKMGLFGKVREPARIRARVRPLTARNKDERRDRRRRGGGKTRKGQGGPEKSAVSHAQESERAPDKATNVDQGGAVSAAREDVPVETQAEVGESFLRGLAEHLDLEITIERRQADEMIEIALDGPGIGILVGSRGSTISALQELTRTVVLRETGAARAMIVVDVGGYRSRRRSALEEFTKRICAEVVETGSQRRLEPMNPADRKVIHDTVNTVAGVVSRSEGEDPSRYVVISPQES